MQELGGGTLLSECADGEYKQSSSKDINTPENGRRPQLKPIGARIAADAPRSSSFSAAGLNVYRQRVVSLSTCPAGAGTRRVSSSDTTRMQIRHDLNDRVSVNNDGGVYTEPSVNTENQQYSSVEPPLQNAVNMLTTLLTCKHSPEGGAL